MNKVILSGHIVRDPETRYAGKGICVAKYTLAVRRIYKKEGEPDADFINCTVFGKTAEFAEKYFRKGTKVVVEGRWQTGSYMSKSGQKVYTNECYVERQEFGESKTQSQNSQSYVQNTQPAPEPTPAGYDDGFMDVDLSSDGLPFS